jgi:hypothetical protein
MIVPTPRTCQLLDFFRDFALGCGRWPLFEFGIIDILFLVENSRMTHRRGFLGLLGAFAATAVCDPERLLWTPGRKLISIPAPRVATPADWVCQGSFSIEGKWISLELPNRYPGSFDWEIVGLPLSTSAARSMS